MWPITDQNGLEPARGGQRRPEVAILGADQKKRGLWGREWAKLNVEDRGSMEGIMRIVPDGFITIITLISQ